MDTREPANFHSYIFSLLLILAALALAPMARGQETLPDTIITDSPIDDIGELSATRPVEHIKADQLEPQSRRFSDALNMIPGLQVRTEGGPAINIRGSQSAARTLVLQDGVPLNFADGFGFNPLFVAQENIDEVSLLKSPSSSLFGRNAMAGALEFRSVRLREPKIFASYGSFNTTQIYAGTPLDTKTLPSQVTVYESHTSGNFPYQVPRVGGTDTRGRDDSEILRTTLSAGKKSDTWEWNTYHLLARQIGSTPGDIYKSYSPFAFNNWGELSSFNAQVPLSPSMSIGSRTSFKYLSEAYGPSPGSVATSIRQGINGSWRWSDNRIDLLAETAYERFTPSDGSAIQNVTINEIGMAGLFPFNKQWTLQPALRVSSENGGVTPSFGASGVDSNDWKYFVNYAEGYNPPAVSQKYTQFLPSYVGNPALLAEHSYEVDAGFEKQFPDYFIHFEAFSRHMQNLIENRIISPGVTSPQNVGTAQASGFEAQGKWHWICDLSGALTYLHSRKVDVSEPTLLSPEIQINLWASKQIETWQIKLQDTQWSSYFDSDLTGSGRLVELNGWNTLDLFIKKSFSSSLWAQLSVLNILNQARELKFGYPEPQTYYLLTVTGTL